MEGSCRTADPQTRRSPVVWRSHTSSSNPTCRASLSAPHTQELCGPWPLGSCGPSVRETRAQGSLGESRSKGRPPGLWDELESRLRSWKSRSSHTGDMVGISRGDARVGGSGGHSDRWPPTARAALGAQSLRRLREPELFWKVVWGLQRLLSLHLGPSVGGEG